MKQAYLYTNLHQPVLDLIAIIDVMIESYVRQGFRLTVRAIYYQCIARDIFPEDWIDAAYNTKHGLPASTKNTLKNYKRLADTLNKARLCGLLDWEAISDENRSVTTRPHWQSGQHFLTSTAPQFYMDHWEGQRKRVFVVVEKAALIGVLEGVCNRWDIPLLAARGYPSVSIMREMALAQLQPALDEGVEPIVLHLGDHDPSGIDMSRDLQERFDMFCSKPVEVRRIALTMTQIEEVQPPPNPAKTTDSRFASYETIYGDESWELDALEPKYINSLVEKHVKKCVNMKLWDARAKMIEGTRELLIAHAETF